MIVKHSKASRQIRIHSPFIHERHTTLIDATLNNITIPIIKRPAFFATRRK
jgi:hypothetical protein